MTTPEQRSYQPVHEVQPPPQDSHIVRLIAEILAARKAIEVTAAGLSVLLGVPIAVIIALLRLLARGSAHIPRARMASHGVPPDSAPASLPRRAANDDLYFRAAYIEAAAHRVTRGVAGGQDLQDAIAEEARYAALHEKARRGRLSSAGRVAAAQLEYGPLLGWYLNPELNNETECILADGNNFYADEGTVIGYPGMVHPECGCIPGPPHILGGKVDDAVAPIIRPKAAARVKVRRATRVRLVS